MLQNLKSISVYPQKNSFSNSNKFCTVTPIIYMKEVTHIYNLTPEWQTDLAEQLGIPLIDNKILILPESLGKGHSYFAQITPDISVVFVDLDLKTQLKLTRLKSDNPIYIFHFDLSEHTNLIKINNIDYEIGSYDKLDLAIIDNQLQSSFTPAIHERVLLIRILVNKKLLTDFITKQSTTPKSKSKKVSNDLYHYGNIDSNSVLLVKSIKDASIYDLSFESLLKGVSLKLLGNFFNKFYNVSENSANITNAEKEAIEKTKTYLLNNLYGPFPSVTFLATMAGMSESKYKMLFKKYLNNTPNNLFIDEKMILAEKLLKSGEYSTLTEVIYELNYGKLSYFTIKYFEFFGRKPAEDFVKKYHHKH